MTPAAISRIGLVLAVAAALWFTEGSLRGAVCGALLLGAVAGTDLVAQRLRNGGRDRLDVWLALMLARLREYVGYAGLAVGGAATGVPGAWAWAGGALIALSLRDSIAAARDARPGGPDRPAQSRPPRPIDAADPSRPWPERPPGDASLTAELLGDSRSDERGGPGATEMGTVGGEPALIRTVPKGTPWPGWAAGRAEVLRSRPLPGDSGGEAETASGAADTAPDTAQDADQHTEQHAKVGAAGTVDNVGAVDACGSTGTTARSDHDQAAAPEHTRSRGRLAVLTRLAAFPQAARFGVVAVTITIWDARVTFIALIVGCALATTAELTRPADRKTAR